MMANLRMRAVYAAIHFAVEHKTHANSGTNRDIDQLFLVPPSAPACFPESSSVPIIFHCHLDVEHLLQMEDWILPLPLRKEIYPTGRDRRHARARYSPPSLRATELHLAARRQDDAGICATTQRNR